MNKIYDFILNFRSKHGTDPKFIPITKVELVDIIRTSGPMMQVMENTSMNQIMGFDVFDTPYAEVMRSKQISVPITVISETVKVDLQNWRIQQSQLQIDQELSRSLIVHVLSNKSVLEVTFEWDILARLKRLLRVSKWFPIKSKTVKVDCLILYPYAQNSLPHNRHSVKFSLHK